MEALGADDGMAADEGNGRRKRTKGVRGGKRRE